MTIVLVRTLMWLVCLVGMCTWVTYGQSRIRIQIPADFLSALDKEDRDCVTGNGDLRQQVSVESIHLTNGKSRQLIVRGSGLCLCGAQNCGFWVYRKRGSQDELILKGIGSTKVRIGHALAHGYRDIIAESHASAIETLIRTYRFDGRQYQLHRCVTRAFYDQNGNPIRRPEFRPCQ